MNNDAKDAARYRWLRTQHWTDSEYVVTRVSNLRPGMQIYSGENLDSIVDSAVSANQPEAPKEGEQSEIERLRVIARRIADARERDHWNDLDDAVDDLLSEGREKASDNRGNRDFKCPVCDRADPHTHGRYA